MEIKVVPQPNKKLIGILFLDGEELLRSPEFARPGCAVRHCLNHMSVLWGIPDTELTLSVEGW